MIGNTSQEYALVPEKARLLFNITFFPCRWDEAWPMLLSYTFGVFEQAMAVLHMQTLAILGMLLILFCSHLVGYLMWQRIELRNYRIVGNCGIGNY
jgi:hypothetical protein